MDTDDIYRSIWDYREIKSNPFFPFKREMNDPQSFLREKENLYSKFIKLENFIKENSNPEVVDHFKENLRITLDLLLSALRKNKLGHSIDRNQGLIIENFVYGKVISSLNSAISFGVSYPDFYFNEESDFDETPLRTLLLDFKEEVLRKERFNNYFELESLTDTCVSKIKELWKTDNEKSLTLINR